MLRIWSCNHDEGFVGEELQPRGKSKSYAPERSISLPAEAVHLLSGVLASRYTLPQLNPFLDWNVNQRYAHRNNFDSTRLANHRTGGELVRVLITKAKLDGFL